MFDMGYRLNSVGKRYVSPEMDIVDRIPLVVEIMERSLMLVRYSLSIPQQALGGGRKSESRCDIRGLGRDDVRDRCVVSVVGLKGANSLAGLILLESGGHL